MHSPRRAYGFYSPRYYLLCRKHMQFLYTRKDPGHVRSELETSRWPGVNCQTLVTHVAHHACILPATAPGAVNFEVAAVTLGTSGVEIASTSQMRSIPAQRMPPMHLLVTLVLYAGSRGRAQAAAERHRRSIRRLQRGCLGASGSKHIGESRGES
jgi:hypothetical protein